MADRQKLIDVFMHMGDHIRNLDEYGVCYDSTLAEAIEDVVAMLKTEQNVVTDNNVGSKWIPVSERLPESLVPVLCWYEYFRYGNYNCMYQTYGLGYYFRDGHWGGEVSNGQQTRVMAWMPLPEPPNEGQS